MFQDIGRHSYKMLFQFLRRQRFSLSVCNRQRQLRLVAKKGWSPCTKNTSTEDSVWPQTGQSCLDWKTRDCALADKMEKETREKQTLMKLDSDKYDRRTDRTNWHPHITNQTSCAETLIRLRNRIHCDDAWKTRTQKREDYNVPEWKILNISVTSISTTN